MHWRPLLITEEELRDYYIRVLENPWYRTVTEIQIYQAFADEGQHKAKNADLIFGIGEVVGLGERHQTGDQVLESLQLHEVNQGEYEWYYEMKNRFPLKTSGFGMGIERFMLWLLKHDDIRDLQLLPRFNGINVVP